MNNPDSEELLVEIDKIVEKHANDLKKKILTLITRREKKLLKAKPQKEPVTAQKKQRVRKRYHSSASETESSS